MKKTLRKCSHVPVYGVYLRVQKYSGALEIKNKEKNSYFKPWN